LDAEGGQQRTGNVRKALFAEVNHDVRG
jgi:hypothetical protein